MSLRGLLFSHATPSCQSVAVVAQDLPGASVQQKDPFALQASVRVQTHRPAELPRLPIDCRDVVRELERLTRDDEHRLSGVTASAPDVTATHAYTKTQRFHSGKSLD